MATLNEPDKTKHPSTYSTLNQIEEMTKQSVSIHTRLTPFILSKCHSQLQSPLFTLPAELRDIIFSLATQPYYAPGTFFDETDVEYRPNHHAKWTVSTALLKTCRRIWLETNHFPIRQAHHCFYLPSQRDARKDSQEGMSYQEFATRLTQNNRQLLKNIHLFASACLLSRQQGQNLGPGPLLQTTGACPETLTITIRHIDWPGWHIFAPLAMSSPLPWLPTLLTYPLSPRLREIRLELETLARKVDTELRPIVAVLRKRHASVESTDELGSPITWEVQEPLPEVEWKGSPWFEKVDRRRASESPGLCRILGLVWKVRRGDEGEQEVLSDERDVRDLPMFSFCDADREPKGKVEPENAAARKQWEERWEQEGSLLRFCEQ